MTPILTTSLPLPLHSQGKVRDTYRLSDRELLMVATDRISAFDVVLPTPIPEKGRVLNQLSLSWFRETADLVRNHVAPELSIPPAVLSEQPGLEQRSMRVVMAEPILFECVVRGYLSGSGWKDYQRTGAIAGERLPEGLRESDRLPEPIFTPSTKATSGHDENIDAEQGAALVGAERFEEVERTALALYRFAAEHAAARGILIADTKFEFGVEGEGSLVLADEAFTPDSSRFWPAYEYKPGGPQSSFDKQFVRDYCESLGWDKTAPGPELPDDVVAGTRARYVDAFERLTELPFDRYVDDPESVLG